MLCKIGFHWFTGDSETRVCTRCGRREIFVYSPEGGWDQGYWMKEPNKPKDVGPWPTD